MSNKKLTKSGLPKWKWWKYLRECAKGGNETYGYLYAELIYKGKNELATLIIISMKILNKKLEDKIKEN